MPRIATQYNERMKSMNEVKLAKGKTIQWQQFADIVEDEHIVSYVATQYGDFPDKTIAKFTAEKIQGKLEAYVDRIGKGARGPGEAARDAIKIAHFACYLYALLTKGDAQADLG